jgi:hypothetical protein
VTMKVKYVSRKEGSLESARMKSCRGGGGRVAAVRRSEYCERNENFSDRELIWMKRIKMFSV